MAFVIVQFIVEVCARAVPKFLGTGDITHEDEFRFHSWTEIQL